MSTRDTATLTLKLTKKTKALIERRAAAENFSSPGEFVENLVRQKLIAEEKARLDQLLKEGLASGPAVRADAAYWREVEAEVKSRVGSGAGKPRKRKAS